ncbi:phosphate signaling complex protein PhoU [Erysipelothrix sp. HDW6A]|uniref:phosphate signaling complex protein PhoU n=1 Tax=Erysipelothrix sp. HDW6A TaxID=2714928 RepID=UPI00140CD5B5|nr:phosphate signaling complex protein PhoU [Erysipelothrix sp. HDW6A]QIK57654.1 phosphate signaling complex protein PhoU [Erysipelothrix sp. HDW6A]
MGIQDIMIEFENELTNMATKVRYAMSEAITALQSNDKVLALKVVERDEIINNIDHTINNSAISALSLQQPVARDLRLLIGGIKIATDLERIGDYAKNIGRFVIKGDEDMRSFQEGIFEMASIFMTNFDLVLEALEEKDVKKAYEAAQQDDLLDQGFKTIVDRYADMSETHIFPLQLAEILRNIERAGDHSKNICEQVIYIVNGQRVDFG